MYRVMIITTDKEMRDTLSVGLVYTRKFEIHTASPEEVQERLCEQPFQLIFIDHPIGKTSSMDFLAEIRKKEPAAKAIVVAEKNKVKKLSERKTELNVFSFLIKPIDPVEFYKLSKKVTDCIESRR